MFKIRTSRLRKASWALTLPLLEARENEELISLSDSQILRWIDQLNGLEHADADAMMIRAAIKRVQEQPNQRKEIIKLYHKLDQIQFKPDYLCLVIDKDKDYRRACKGFTVNGIKYVRLLGTNGGIKNKTIVFVSERLAPFLRQKITNGRNLLIEHVPAKLEAYQALVCSGSQPVSLPKGILVVKDCETSFLEDVLTLTDEDDGEPVMTYVQGAEISLCDSDGYGLISPTLAHRWSAELGLEYTACGMNTRFAFEKGMVYCFDYRAFAEKIADSYFVSDAWGEMVDIRSVELILTTSMVKLWDSYTSCRDYLETSISNGYTFSITKVCKERLESERNLNYQFIQSFQLSSEQIGKLIQPTVDEIHEIMSGDPMKTILYLKGLNLNIDSVQDMEDDIAKAIIAEPGIIHDPYIAGRIHYLIKKRITEAKVGVIKVHGNYSVVSGDPYALCQSMFGMKVTGLLKAGEAYNQYWNAYGAKKLVCFRAPMTCHNNIRLFAMQDSTETTEWYKHMNACTIINAWDTAAHALNGMDKDGDIVLLTDNPILLDHTKELPAIMCVQRKARKTVCSEQDMIEANIASFGDDIGKTTNWITSMFAVRDRFLPDSKEYAVLEYRIKCGQLYQQNAIDKAKGILAKPMPKYWYNRGTFHKENFTVEEEAFQHRVVADKKPYFMRYIYPSLKQQYITYTKNTEKKALREFKKSFEELHAAPHESLTEAEAAFLHYYHLRMPVEDGNCIMNQICRGIEKEFDSIISKISAQSEFDYSIMKSGCEYNAAHYRALGKLFRDYQARVSAYMQCAKKTRIMQQEKNEAYQLMVEHFRVESEKICSDVIARCDMLLDLCYQSNRTKQFAWDICGHQIIKNLLLHSGKYHLPIPDGAGEIKYRGQYFKQVEIKAGGLQCTV